MRTVKRKGGHRGWRHRDKNHRLKLVLKFLLVFNLLSIPMYAAIYSGFSLPQLQDFVASISSGILREMGYANALRGHEITVQQDGAKRIDVSWDSSGWKSLYAMFALVMATPLVGMVRKLDYVFSLLPVVFGVNVLRVVTTIAVSVTFGFSYFDFVHLFLWRYLLIGTILALWVLYLKRENIIG